MVKRPKKSLPLPAARALRKLGTDIHDARRRRRIPTTLLADRALVSRTTLDNVEKEDPGASECNRLDGVSI